MAGAMPRRKPAPPPVQPTRRRRGSGSVSVRSDSRVVVTLPADLDPERKPLYSPPGTRTAWASVEQATRWLDAEVARRRNPTPDRATDDEQLGAYLARWYRLYRNRNRRIWHIWSGGRYAPDGVAYGRP